jgi:cob(I)alamin adenosyltransferase
VKKTSERIEAIGAVDELNSVIGVLLVHEIPPELHPLLTDIQHELFDLGGELSIPGQIAITDNQVRRLETALDGLNENLPPLKEFILPGGSEAAATCHVARAICRRAERRVVRLGEIETTNTATARYLNRLSDLLFVIARVLNVRAGRTDVLWTPGKNR